MKKSEQIMIRKNCVGKHEYYFKCVYLFLIALIVACTQFSIFVARSIASSTVTISFVVIGGGVDWRVLFYYAKRLHQKKCCIKCKK
jgi:hypothetical protein